MISQLPDIQSVQISTMKDPVLTWVGMSEIQVSVLVPDLADRGSVRTPAWVDVGVNLVDPKAKGIHMSRMYQIVASNLVEKTLDFENLEQTLKKVLESQLELSTAASLQVRLEMMMNRPALKSSLSGPRNYPMTFEVRQDSAGVHRSLEFEVLYSSTCPQSAALARVVMVEEIRKQFGQKQISAESLVEWLENERGLPATPHAQRSVAKIRLELGEGSRPPQDWIDLTERSLGTPVQTAVKRQDEMEFARLNAQNLMFCEDAARKLKALFSAQADVLAFHGEVKHMESLHAHNATARFSGRGSQTT